MLPAAYQRERRQLAARRKAAFATEPTGANQVWQLDFSEFETTTGGAWRIAGCQDYWSKYEHPWHVSPTANQHDAITAIELALTGSDGRTSRSRSPRNRRQSSCPISVSTQGDRSWTSPGTSLRRPTAWHGEPST